MQKPSEVQSGEDVHEEMVLAVDRDTSSIASMLRFSSYPYFTVVTFITPIAYLRLTRWFGLTSLQSDWE